MTSTTGNLDTSASTVARVLVPPLEADFDGFPAPWLTADQEPEVRRWLARELHDGVASRLTEMLIDMEHMKRRQEAQGIGGGELEAFQQSTRQALDQLRRLLGQLRGESSQTVGFVDGLKAMLARVERRSGIRTHLTCDRAWPNRLTANAAHNLQGIVAEALRNALYHSSAQRIVVELRLHASQALLSIVDDGAGWDAVDEGGSMGLLGMRERAMLVGGELRIRSAPDKGTRVQVTFALDSLV
jgi:signal transduction histidine kinase